tara:strand:+ start:472 stop:591 length:120 start_codon:yes stop_codon:yes gene_type:complete
MKEFLIKLIVYFVALGLPLAMLAFLMLGVAWLAKQVFEF